MSSDRRMAGRPTAIAAWAAAMAVSAFVLSASVALAQTGSASSSGDDYGGHVLEFGVYAGHVDFDDAIRFENDLVLGLTAATDFAPWFRLGVDLGQVTALDSERDAWTRSVIVAIHGRVEPWAERPVSGSALFGVSFMAFAEDESADALSEGLDLGPALRWNVSPRWIVRADVLFRMQTFRLVTRSASGAPVGEREETGYLWSRLLRVGLSRAF